MTATAVRPRASAGADRARSAVRGVGELLITLGVVVLLFCVYELQVTNLYTAHDQARLGDQLSRAWDSPAPDEPPLGDAYARFYLPRLRGTDPLVVVQGVGVPDLKKGPGHLPTSAAPGEVGNLVLSGHRTTYGAPFADLGELQAGDALVVETADRWVTYRTTGSQVVAPSAVEVTLPVPGSPDATPTQAVITLTTCDPKYSARQRLIVSGLLADTRPKSAGRPPALTDLEGT